MTYSAFIVSLHPLSSRVLTSSSRARPVFRSLTPTLVLLVPHERCSFRILDYLCSYLAALPGIFFCIDRVIRERLGDNGQWTMYLTSLLVGFWRWFRATSPGLVIVAGLWCEDATGIGRRAGGIDEIRYALRIHLHNASLISPCGN